MEEMLQQGARFPKVEFDLVGGGKLVLPDDSLTRYSAVLFYRGHW